MLNILCEYGKYFLSCKKYIYYYYTKYLLFKSSNEEIFDKYSSDHKNRYFIHQRSYRWGLEILYEENL